MSRSSEDELYSDRLSMAIDDLSMCRSFGALLLRRSKLNSSEREEKDTDVALFISLIVTYGKSFNKSKSVDPKLNQSIANRFGGFSDRLTKKLSAEDQIFHERILNERDKSFAHSDGVSRSYRNSGGSNIKVGRNIYVPWSDDSIERVLVLVGYFFDAFRAEDEKIEKVTK